jgi:hypothetical protein
MPVDFDEYIQIDNEIMEVVGLTINSNGTATLNVERGVDGTIAAAHAANAPVYLVSDQRGSVVGSGALAPAVDIGSVQSSAAIPAVGPGLALTMGISSGTLNGTTTALTNSANQAVFNNLSVPTIGTFQEMPNPVGGWLLVENQCNSNLDEVQARSRCHGLIVPLAICVASEK